MLQYPFTSIHARLPKLVRLTFLSGLAVQMFGQGIPVISTLVGGGPNNMAATAVSLNQLSGGVVDSAGNYYAATESQVVRVDTQNRISVVAGNGVRSYSGDGGLAVNAGLN